jgi:hypothetical protein
MKIGVIIPKVRKGLVTETTLNAKTKPIPILSIIIKVILSLLHSVLESVFVDDTCYIRFYVFIKIETLEAHIFFVSNF